VSVTDRSNTRSSGQQCSAACQEEKKLSVSPMPRYILCTKLIAFSSVDWR
jgi:hypothetical protein